MSAVSLESVPLTRLRPMQPTDLPEVFTIEQQAYVFPWTLRILQDCLKAGYRAWVLEEGTHLVGYAFLSVAAGEAHLLNLCVDPSYHNRGYGRRLLNHILQLARQYQVDMIFLEVRPSNIPALHLYTSAGFNQIGVRKNYYPHQNGREDALIFGMDLTG
ncbi:ribosomal-protein-alanine N-acetyltransferase [Thioflexithrix psekupsensis]|uniref:[Ribosomal protein bS18]-alanine N-acetyltransferase n=2 Tax=Thioflexithrix psekupsensis TaxID=1570016 RepID=A0A251X3W3_9GAMM|nr:ribosomal-protein-alanine N-acetyltransferase [Thioflexithrix psekupsensis]